MMRLLPKKVYMEGSKANLSLVKILKERPPLNEVDFEILPNRTENLIRRITEIEGKATFVWGTGSMHHLSHHFNLKKGKVRKRILDNHDDWFNWHSFENGPSFSNHARMTNQLTNTVVELFLTLERQKYLTNQARRYACDPDIESFRKKSMITNFAEIQKHLVNAGSNGSQDDVRIHHTLKAEELLHLSIDLDCIPNILVMRLYQTSDGFTSEEVLSALKDALETGRLVRLDFGGIRHDFDTLVQERLGGKLPENLLEKFENTIQVCHSILALSLFGG